MNQHLNKICSQINYSGAPVSVCNLPNKTSLVREAEPASGVRADATRAPSVVCFVSHLLCTPHQPVSSKSPIERVRVSCPPLPPAAPSSLQPHWSGCLLQGVQGPRAEHLLRAQGTPLSGEHTPAEQLPGSALPRCTQPSQAISTVPRPQLPCAGSRRSMGGCCVGSPTSCSWADRGFPLTATSVSVPGRKSCDKKGRGTCRSSGKRTPSLLSLHLCGPCSC